MPRGDKTGPAGMGPMTGRAAGYCAGYPDPGFMNQGWGPDLGRVRVRGFWNSGRGGWRHRHWYHATGLPGWRRAGMQWPAYPPPVPRTFGPLTTKEQELDALKRQTEFLQQALDELRTRIGEVESSTEGQKNK